MGSVASVSPGLTDLLQTLTNLNSPVMSSQTAVNALQKASPSDIVQLSVAANQLQSVDAIFGISSSPNSNMSSALTALENSATTSGGTSTPSVLSGASPADQAANAQAALQGELTQGLFGAGTTSRTGTLFNAIG